MIKVCLKQAQAPGDLLMLSVALRDLNLTYPDKYDVKLLTYYPEVFYSNPYISDSIINKFDDVLDMDYGPYLKKTRRKRFHFSDVFVIMLNEKLSINIQKTSPKGVLELNEKEKSDEILKRLNIKKPFWIINAGVKQDIPLKGYPSFLYQVVVNELHRTLNFVQVGSDTDIHPYLNNTINTVGSTNDLRDFFSLVYHCEGVVGPVSMQMHLAAIFDKKCVVVAGGREEPTWEQYDGHVYLNTIGKLNCCKDEGCWKSQFIDCLNFNDYPECYKMIKPEQIIEQIIKLKEKN